MTLQEGPWVLEQARGLVQVEAEALPVSGVRDAKLQMTSRLQLDKRKETSLEEQEEPFPHELHHRMD